MSLFDGQPRLTGAFGGTNTRRHDDNDETSVSLFDGFCPSAA
jgi:hypothetical protein